MILKKVVVFSYKYISSLEENGFRKKCQFFLDQSKTFLEL